MPYYHENSRIRDKKQHGLYYGQYPIDRMFYATSESDAVMVYRYQPYNTNEQVYYASPASYSVQLQKGVYKLALGGGWGGYWQSGVTVTPNTVWYTSRGGGAFVELILYNPTTRSLVLSAPTGATATAKLGGTTLITCYAQTSNSTAGGSYNIAQSPDILQVLTARNGNSGGQGPWNPATVTTVSDYGNWGSSANSSGGARLEFIRRDL